MDICMDMSMGTYPWICIDISMEVSSDILQILVNAGGVVAWSGDHAEGAVRGQRMLQSTVCSWFKVTGSAVL